MPYMIVVIPLGRIGVRALPYNGEWLPYTHPLETYLLYNAPLLLTTSSSN